MQGTPEQSCLVGDSPFDLQSAAVVDMPCHLVATGTHDLNQLAETGADSVHANLSELGRECFGLDLDANSVA